MTPSKGNTEAVEAKKKVLAVHEDAYWSKGFMVVYSDKSDSLELSSDELLEHDAAWISAAQHPSVQQYEPGMEPGGRWDKENPPADSSAEAAEGVDDPSCCQCWLNGTVLDGSCECDCHHNPAYARPAAEGGEQTASRDWTEDASHENGNYSCKCVTCGNSFIGHKRRVVCKLCAVPQPASDPSPSSTGEQTERTDETEARWEPEITDAMWEEARKNDADPTTSPRVNWIAISLALSTRLEQVVRDNDARQRLSSQQPDHSGDANKLVSQQSQGEVELPRLKWLQPSQFESWKRKVNDPDWYDHRYHKGASDRVIVSAIRDLIDTREHLREALATIRTLKGQK